MHQEAVAGECLERRFGYSDMRVFFGKSALTFHPEYAPATM